MKRPADTAAGGGEPAGKQQCQGVSQPPSMSRAAAEEALRHVYAEHAPERIQKIASLLGVYAGREADIVGKVRRKYLGAVGERLQVALSMRAMVVTQTQLSGYEAALRGAARPSR